MLEAAASSCQQSGACTFYTATTALLHMQTSRSLHGITRACSCLQTITSLCCSTFGKLESKALAFCSPLQSLKSWQHNDCIVVQIDQSGLVLLPPTEDARQLLGRQEVHVQQQHYLQYEVSSCSALCCITDQRVKAKPYLSRTAMSAKLLKQCKIAVQGEW